MWIKRFFKLRFARRREACRTIATEYPGGTLTDSVCSGPKSMVNFSSIASLPIRSPLPKTSEAKKACCVTAISEDRFAFGGNDGDLTIMSSSGFEVMAHFFGHERRITAMCGTQSNGGMVYTGSRDRTILVWNEDKGLVNKIFPAHELVITGLAVGADGFQLVSGSRDNYVRLWDVERRKCIANKRISRNLVTHICWRWVAGHGGGGMIAQSSEDKSTRLYDYRDLQLIGETKRKDQIQTCCELSPDLRYLITTSHNSMGSRIKCEATVWDVRTMKELYVFTDQTGPLSTCRCLSQTCSKHGPSGESSLTTVATGSAEGNLCFWTVSSQERPTTLTSCNLEGAGRLGAIEQLDPNRFVIATDLGGLVVIRTITHEDVITGVKLVRTI
ncbi:unnamed protein product [Calicophoron daubneyi]|uniref:Uncharacterized protein n=1 Tax=Calicophoron daubneyi TaxID=300641 RepID=A0AAV2T2L4_CALDB